MEQDDYDFLRERVRILNIERDRQMCEIEELRSALRLFWEYHFEDSKKFRDWYWEKATSGELPDWFKPRSLRE